MRACMMYSEASITSTMPGSGSRSSHSRNWISIGCSSGWKLSSTRVIACTIGLPFSAPLGRVSRLVTMSWFRSTAMTTSAPIWRATLTGTGSTSPPST